MRDATTEGGQQESAKEARETDAQASNSDDRAWRMNSLRVGERDEDGALPPVWRNTDDRACASSYLGQKANAPTLTSSLSCSVRALHRPAARANTSSMSWVAVALRLRCSSSSLRLEAWSRTILSSVEVASAEDGASLTLARRLAICARVQWIQVLFICTSIIGTSVLRRVLIQPSSPAEPP